MNLLIGILKLNPKPTSKNALPFQILKYITLAHRITCWNWLLYWTFYIHFLLAGYWSILFENNDKVDTLTSSKIMIHKHINPVRYSIWNMCSGSSHRYLVALMNNPISKGRYFLIGKDDRPKGREIFINPFIKYFNNI